MRPCPECQNNGMIEKYSEGTETKCDGRETKQVQKQNAMTQKRFDDEQTELAIDMKGTACKEN